GEQMSGALRQHSKLNKKEARERCVEMLHAVKVPSPDKRIDGYSFELSGGMRQRVMIATALLTSPDLLIADEPTTALDVTIQAQILNLMVDLKERLGTAIILITHDLGVMAEMAQRVVVMYAGRKVEEAPVAQLFSDPLHPYTVGLLGSIPRLNSSLATEGASVRLQEIEGTVPSLRERIPGCAFAPRCHAATQQCREQLPVLEEKDIG
ncbi:MAG: ABC transporter ATP-binding protein, partial [Pseudomonadota bacterium]|nr:ABC transporter ATP-binding protein [Pseudomonadota bacterium]